MILDCTTNKGLQRTYKYVNRYFFGNKLSKNPPLKFGQPIDRTALATTEFLDQKIIGITIKKFCAARINSLSLIHEMIHIKFHTQGKYGREYNCIPPSKGNPSKTPWVKEVRRLARLGLFDWGI